jgi:hypothetical protein
LHLVPPAGVSPSLPAEEREESSVDAGLSQPQAEDGRRPRGRSGLPSVPGKGTGEVRSTSAPEVIPQSQAEGRQTETGLPAQFSPEELPAAEEQAPEAAAAAPVQVEVEGVTSASPLEGEVETVSLEEPQAESETELSLQSPPVELSIEEEQSPKIEVPAPDQMADEIITSIGYLREEGEANSQEEPQAEPETELPAQLPDGESPAEEEQASETEPAATVPPEDLWWTTPGDPLQGRAEDGPEQRVLKLKASPPPEAQAVQVSIEAEPPPSAEDWWVSGAEIGPGEADDRPVLKLKASPPPEAEAEQMPDEAEPSPSAEDWWTPPSKLKDV